MHGHRHADARQGAGLSHRDVHSRNARRAQAKIGNVLGQGFEEFKTKNEELKTRNESLFPSTIFH